MTWRFIFKRQTNDLRCIDHSRFSREIGTSPWDLTEYALLLALLALGAIMSIGTLAKND
jgi:hypothetical protein